MHGRESPGKMLAAMHQHLWQNIYIYIITSDTMPRRFASINDNDSDFVSINYTTPWNIQL
jgi:hypothetical protein